MATSESVEAELSRRSSRPPRPHRWRRWVFTALGLLVVVALLGGLKGAQIASLMAFGKKAAAAGPPPETVSTAVAAAQTWNETLESVGSVTTARGVTIGNDLPGMVSRLSFESGATVRQGQVLVELDSSVERAQLGATRAKLQLARTNAGRTRDLVASGAIAQAQKDTDEAGLAAATAEERALLAQIDRKTIRAPFAGRLGIRLVNVGQYLAPGTPITLLEAEDEARYVDFALPQQALGRVAAGMAVRLSVEGGDAGAVPPAEGKVYAVEPALDPATRNVKLRATLPENAQFRPGMFVKVEVIQPKKNDVVAIPAIAVVHASFGDSVFIVEAEPNPPPGAGASKVVRQQFVRLGKRRGDFIAVSDGVKAGEEIVTAGAFKLRNKSRIVVNREVDVKPELSPHPENR
jgi:membrane fusion protein (multidrug efflux system)